MEYWLADCTVDDRMRHLGTRSVLAVRAKYDDAKN